MKITVEAIEAAARAIAGQYEHPASMYAADAERALEAALPHLTDDGAAAPRADDTAIAVAESATTTVAPSSPHPECSGHCYSLTESGAGYVDPKCRKHGEGATPAIDRQALKYLLSYHYYDAKWSKEHQGFRCVCGWLGEDHVQHVLDLIGASEDDQ